MRALPAPGKPSLKAAFLRFPDIKLTHRVGSPWGRACLHREQFKFDTLAGRSSARGDTSILCADKLGL